MKIIRHTDVVPADSKGSVIVLGNFDGFHKGHQTVVGKAGNIARETNTTLSVLSMEPHPRIFFNPDQKEFRLNSFRSKAHLLESFGVDQFIVLHFDQKLASMEPEEFVKEILLQNLGVSHVVVGYDYCFGAKRRGDVKLLAEMSEQHGFGLTVIEKVMEGDHTYSSTSIREALSDGDVRTVADRLGHWWHVEGHVKRGDQRGRTIDFPTANLFLDGYIEPKYGVYAVRVIIEEGNAKGCWDAIANVGRRPTFDKEDVLLESHIFDFKHDIYELPIKVEFVDFIRAEQKFDGLDALKEQIEKDCLVAREVLKKKENQQSYIPSPKLTDHLT